MNLNDEMKKCFKYNTLNIILINKKINIILILQEKIIVVYIVLNVLN